MHKYRRKTLRVLFFLLALFFAIALFSFIQLNRKISMLGIGLGYYTEDILIMALSVLSMLKVVHELYKVESHKEYEQSIKRKIK